MNKTFVSPILFNLIFLTSSVIAMQLAEDDAALINRTKDLTPARELGEHQAYSNTSPDESKAITSMITRNIFTGHYYTKFSIYDKQHKIVKLKEEKIVKLKEEIAHLDTWIALAIANNGKFIRGKLSGPSLFGSFIDPEIIIENSNNGAIVPYTLPFSPRSVFFNNNATKIVAYPRCEDDESPVILSLEDHE
jgi:hypothetical protein